jgi:hypothetical protein
MQPCTCCSRFGHEIPPDQSAGRAFGSDGCCHPCQEHKGFAQAADRDHRRWWRVRLDDQQRLAEEERSRLLARVSEVQAELDKERLTRPERLVEKWINQDEIDAAQSEAQRAFRSREMAFQQLSLVRLLHRESVGGRCRCGTPLAKCQTFALLDGYPALMAWEREQLRRYGARVEHALPLDHPLLHDPRALARFLDQDGDVGDDSDVQGAG